LAAINRCAAVTSGVTPYENQQGKHLEERANQKKEQGK
jgi:hypothetical protein